MSIGVAATAAMVNRQRRRERRHVDAPAGVVGEPYSFDVPNFGGTAPFTYELVDTDLQAGLAMAGPTISGTPTEAGRRQVTVNVTDANLLHDRLVFAIEIF